MARSQRLHRRRFRPRVRGRRRTTTTLAGPVVTSPAPVYPVDEAKPNPTSPRLKEFCDRVIRTITESLSGENFLKVTMYQDIWFLVAKYDIPVEDHSIDIVVLIDQLCNGDDSQKENEEPMDNNIDIGPTNGLSLEETSKPWPGGRSGGRRPPSVITKSLGSPGSFGRPGSPGSRGDFTFYPTAVKVEAVTKTPLLSPSYPRVA